MKLVAAASKAKVVRERVANSRLPMTRPRWRCAQVVNRHGIEIGSSIGRLRFSILMRGVSVAFD